MFDTSPDACTDENTLPCSQNMLPLPQPSFLECTQCKHSLKLSMSKTFISIWSLYKTKTMRWLYWKNLKIHTIVISSWRLIEKKGRVTFFFIKLIVYDPSWRVLQIWTNQTICWQIRQLAVRSLISFIQSWCFSTIESKYKYLKTSVNKNLLVPK